MASALIETTRNETEGITRVIQEIRNRTNSKFLQHLEDWFATMCKRDSLLMHVHTVRRVGDSYFIRIDEVASAYYFPDGSANIVIESKPSIRIETGHPWCAATSGPRYSASDVAAMKQRFEDEQLRISQSIEGPKPTYYKCSISVYLASIIARMLREMNLGLDSTEILLLEKEWSSYVAAGRVPESTSLTHYCTESTFIIIHTRFILLLTSDADLVFVLLHSLGSTIAYKRSWVGSWKPNEASMTPVTLDQRVADSITAFIETRCMYRVDAIRTAMTHETLESLQRQAGEKWVGATDASVYGAHLAADAYARRIQTVDADILASEFWRLFTVFRDSRK